jgi:hypothetical protein
MHLIQDRNLWWAFVGTVMNVWVPYEDLPDRLSGCPFLRLTQHFRVGWFILKKIQYFL